jgi:pilus assembly protein Flp/PilA
MNDFFLKLSLELRGLVAREEGQDLVEYALVVSLIAVVCIAGVNNLATAVTTVFSNIDKALFP